MARPKKDKDVDFFAELAENTGGEVLLGSGASKYYFNTGNLALNWACSGRYITGGFPTGVTETYGGASSGKSLLMMALMGCNQRNNGFSVLEDAERASNEHFAIQAGHVDAAKLIVHKPTNIEETQQLITKTTKLIREKKGADSPILFGWDSITVSMTAREWREMGLPPDYTQADYKRIVGGKEQPGERAKAAGGALRKLNPFLSDNNASLFVINQTRSQIGVMMGNPETTGGGGKALPFYANLRLRTSMKKKFVDKNGKPMGVLVKFANKKSRAFLPFLEVDDVQLFFDKGINPLGGLLSILLIDGRIEESGKGYKVVDKYTNGTEIKFKATKAENLVPAQVLVDCPSLIDAKTSDEVKDFLEPFGEAIELTTSEHVQQTDGSDLDDAEDVAEKLGIKASDEE